jgi:hypothetical protein
MYVEGREGNRCKGRSNCNHVIQRNACVYDVYNVVLKHGSIFGDTVSCFRSLLGNPCSRVGSDIVQYIGLALPGAELRLA